MTDLSHVYGCEEKGCTAEATKRADEWHPGVGWHPVGDFCRAHAVAFQAVSKASGSDVRLMAAPSDRSGQ